MKSIFRLAPWFCFFLVLMLLGACSSGGGNNAPVAADDALSVDRNSSADGTLFAFDPDGHELTFSIVGNGSLGTATITDAATGAYTYTPNADVFGDDEFTFVANDGAADSNIATVTVTIHPAFTVNASGGRGGSNTGGGGIGGPVIVVMNAGNTNLSILNDGAVDASFSPSAPPVDLGDNPLVIDNDATIAVVTDAPPVGVPYLVNGDDSVYISDGDTDLADEPPVTGIRIANGATLTLDLNFNGNTVAVIELPADLHNLGTITTLDGAGDNRGHLALFPANYIASGGIDTAGNDDARHGGAVTINTKYSIFNGGTIATRGADRSGGVDGGNGGAVIVFAQESIENAGMIDARGGDSDDSDAGPGGGIELVANNGSLYNSGDLLSHGGAGELGGAGNQILLLALEGNGIRNSGRLDAHGGSAVEDSGASGGAITLVSTGGPIISSGDMNASGGDTQSTTQNAGNGGSVNLVVSFTVFPLPGIGTSAPRDRLEFHLSGDIDTSGGAAPADGASSGGNGGAVVITQNAPVHDSTTLDLAFLGYAAIDTRGGDASGPGAGGDVTIQMNPAVALGGVPQPGGNIINDARIVTRGGSVDPSSSGAANGGPGGQVLIRGNPDLNAPFDDDAETLTNHGDIDTRSGDSLNSTTQAPPAGVVQLFNRGTVSNSGSINASGGNDAAADGGADGYGNNAGPIFLSSMAGVSNSGDLASRGGSGEFLGGDGSLIWLEGIVVDNSGALDAAGGDADPDLAGSTGGAGGAVLLISPDDFMGVFNDIAADVSGGDGETPGVSGFDLEGGLCLSGNCP
jgi:hypothetical protein